jgi:phosphopantetheine adenylyltransferase
MLHYLEVLLGILEESSTQTLLRRKRRKSDFTNRMTDAQVNESLMNKIDTSTRISDSVVFFLFGML